MSKCNKCCDESSSDESYSSNQCKCRDCTKIQTCCKKKSRCREVNENYQICKYCKQTSHVTSVPCSYLRNPQDHKSECIQSRDMKQKKYIKKCNISSSDYESAISVFNNKPPENGNVIFITINP